ncbi:MAG: hypothetical protein GF308_14750 [Candidatus Heimdallarchaeota archaeon]|nr:hypothetical protein [Candidatus Heimdallarchaeota archaeon]
MKSSSIDHEGPIIYNEWVPIHRFVPVSIVLLVILLIATVITTSIIEQEIRLLFLLFCGGFSLLFIFIGFNFRGVKITLTSETLVVKFGLFNTRSIPLQDITVCEAINASFGRYLGFGVRISFDSSLAFTTNFKEALRLTYQEKRLFVFSTRNQQELCELLVNLNEQIVVK